MSIWLSVPCMELGLERSIDLWVAGSSTRVQRCSVSTETLNFGCSPRPTAVPPTTFHKSSFRNGSERKTCRNCKIKSSSSTEKGLEASWCLQNLRTENNWDFPIKCRIPALLFWVPLHWKGNFSSFSSSSYSIFKSSTEYYFRTKGLSTLLWRATMATVIVAITEECLWNTDSCAQLYWVRWTICPEQALWGDLDLDIFHTR